MDESRAAILRAAQAQLAAKGYRRLTMEGLAAESGVTRQTIHNLFGTKTGVLEAVFDLIALESGMERMREVMMTSDAGAMLDGFIQVFSNFWMKNRLLLKRIHGIAAVDPEFGEAIRARNERRKMGASRVIGHLGDQVRGQTSEMIACLVALTSFEFFDALVESLGKAEAAEQQLPGLIRRAILLDRS